MPSFTATQREVEPDEPARVSSLGYGLAPIGLALIAPAIDAFGVMAVLGACAAVCFPAAALVSGTRDFARNTAGANR